ncbi:Tyrosinase ustQ [Aspergillus parasiticus]
MVVEYFQEKLNKWRYSPVADSPDEEGGNATVKPNKTSFVPVYAVLTIISLITVTVSLVHLLSATGTTTTFPPCKNPAVRREWRSLTTSEKQNFTQAVICLASIPSTWQPNGTIYDDFAILHGGIGSWCHRSASFLPWHRYTLVVFEKALREHCGFTGQVPYWDWTLDWMNLANSSIFNSVDGFGGDGDRTGPEVVGGGHCVIDGPFAGLQPILYNHTYVQHCIARGFRDGDQAGRISGEYYRPESIGGILRKQSYVELVREVEIYLHNPLHQGVNGDFLAMTAANDPLFYVHHAQLDRLWWRWQQENPDLRLKEYHGKHMYNSTGNATLDDILMYGGFAEDIPVSRVMDTKGGFLCYTY